ncbi:hypothetical protein JXL21_02450 [Candidatus Bathyarchaeota archaeon]|nr:hypothetical protein [Candidatus Bathyarchaeota archaeon]
MSQPMASAKETLEKAKGHMGLSEEQRVKVGWAVKIVAQNQSKIWLRTKAGKPMAEETQAAAEAVLGKLEAGAKADEVEAAVAALESKAKWIDGESRRRSMVVT